MPIPCWLTGLRQAEKGGALILLLGLPWPLLSHSADAVIPPAEWHWAAIHGHRIYYATRGSGSTLVLLHGGGDSGEHSFARQLDVFSQRHRIVAPDQVGQGHTPEVPGPLTYTGMMDDTAALLRHLDLKHVDVVGFSDGGILALMLAVRHPELCGGWSSAGSMSRPRVSTPRISMSCAPRRVRTPRRWMRSLRICG